MIKALAVTTTTKEGLHLVNFYTDLDEYSRCLAIAPKGRVTMKYRPVYEEMLLDEIRSRYNAGYWKSVQSFEDYIAAYYGRVRDKFLEYFNDCNTVFDLHREYLNFCATQAGAEWTDENWVRYGIEADFETYLYDFYPDKAEDYDTIYRFNF